MLPRVENTETILATNFGEILVPNFLTTNSGSESWGVATTPQETYARGATWARRCCKTPSTYQTRAHQYIVTRTTRVRTLVGPVVPWLVIDDPRRQYEDMSRSIKPEMVVC